MTVDELTEILRRELAPIRAELATVRARVDGLPVIGEAISVLQRDVRMLRAAVNDMARVNITAGEVEALHEAIDRIQAKQVELETRLTTLERLVPP
jgi:hypothetical protein